MALTFALVLALKGFSSAQDFVADNGEQQAIELADGSVVLLNSASHVHVVLSESSRDLQLLRGEALFKVAKDPRRPFRVHTRDMLVQAVGTQFNVHARRSDSVVSVLEGKVLVSTRDGEGRQRSPMEGVTALSAGEAALVDIRGKIDRHALASAEKAASWPQRRLVFQRATIEDVVRQFNQHNATPKLRLEGIEAGSRHYSMIFNADDPRSFADFLGREEDIVIEKRSDEIIIRSR